MLCFALFYYLGLSMIDRSGESDLPPRVGASTKVLLKLSLWNTLQRVALQLPVVKQIGSFTNLVFVWQEVMQWANTQN